jgi:hypothetical protein
MTDRKEYLKQYYKTHKEDYKRQREEFSKKHPNYKPPHGKESRKKYQRKLREEILHLLGDKCCRCGFSDARALQIDHVHGGGSKALKHPWKEYRKILKAIKAGSKDYQLLCANCNQIKKWEDKEYCKW